MDFVRISSGGIPRGFYRVQTVHGRDCGLGFWCPDCRLHYPAQAPVAVRHCQRVDEAPRFFVRLRLPLYTLPYGKRPLTNLIPIGDDDVVYN